MFQSNSSLRNTTHCLLFHFLVDGSSYVKHLLLRPYTALSLLQHSTSYCNETESCFLLLEYHCPYLNDRSSPHRRNRNLIKQECLYPKDTSCPSLSVEPSDQSHIIYQLDGRERKRFMRWTVPLRIDPSTSTFFSLKPQKNCHGIQKSLNACNRWPFFSIRLKLKCRIQFFFSTGARRWCLVSCKSNFTSLGRRRNDGKTRRELKCASSWKDEEAALHPHHRFFTTFSCWKLRCFALSLLEAVHSSAS